jgi:hypothetical protein
MAENSVEPPRDYLTPTESEPVLTRDFHTAPCSTRYGFVAAILFGAMVLRNWDAIAALRHRAADIPAGDPVYPETVSLSCSNLAAPPSTCTSTPSGIQSSTTAPIIEDLVSTGKHLALCVQSINATIEPMLFD